MRRAAAALIAILALALVVAGAQARTQRAARSVESSINDLRAEHGCGPLRVHAGLARAAGREARLLLSEGLLDHDAGTPFGERLENAMPSAHMWGEDLAFGSGESAQPDAIVDSWMHSPEHREIMLDCHFERVGIGVATGAFGDLGDGAVYTADFAA
jgi:uncharacterized protein YkwD